MVKEPTPEEVAPKAILGYPQEMFAITSRLQSALCGAMRVLLVLTFVLNPVVAYMGDVHELEHGTLVAAVETVDRHHAETAVAERGNADDDTGGLAHELMHVDHAHGAWSPVFPASTAALVLQDHAVVFPPTAPLTSLQQIAGPFRPPIV